MKEIKIVSLMLIAVLISSCQFSQSVNTDLITGAYSRGNGIGCDDVVLEVNGEVERRNEFVFGENVNLIFNNIQGLSRLESMTYPGLSMYIVKNETDTVLSKPSLLDHLNEGTDLSPLQLQANFVTALPYSNNEKYKVFVKIWDKKGEGTFDYSLPFKVIDNELLTIVNSDVEYSSIYLWNETLKQVVFDEHINSEHEFLLILDGIDGFEKIDENVFPILSLDIVDNNGSIILSNANLLSDYETIGVNADLVKQQVFATFSFSEGEVNNPCLLTAVLKDKNSSKEINITANLEIK